MRQTAHINCRAIMLASERCVPTLRQAHGGAAVLKAAQSLGGSQKGPALQLLVKHDVQPGSAAAAAAPAAAAAVISPGK